MLSKCTIRAIKKHLSICLFYSSSLFARSSHTVIHHEEGVTAPWYTGPLIAPSPVVVPLGHVNYEPYFYLTAITGKYDAQWHVVKEPVFWAGTFQPFFQIGVGGMVDIEIEPVLFYNYDQHQAQWVFGDFPFVLDVQICAPTTSTSWIPYIKFALKELFPTGKYRNLDPKKLQTDVGGGGTFLTSAGFVIGEIFRLPRDHFLITRLLVRYGIPSTVHVKGFNAYGGGFGTNGKLLPGKDFTLDLGMELTLTQRWVLACDFIGLWSSKTRFSGNPGILAGRPAPIGLESAVQFSLAPALEYNWNSRLGVIGGCWFSVAGRNVVRYWSAIFAINYYQ